ncbi:tryptophan synthase subunit alpha [Sporosarcina koreensis]|uniref:tryptophan synthase subunit alpha n=1 Tax=Sporosarcina koreensis TaxID=334735 RepID=UPI00058AE551|nr:tryptophan synthase subunit alpha [Sporosarcina koreensis]
MTQHTLTAALQEKKSAGRPLFVPYMMAGDGGLGILHERIGYLEGIGADAVELGIPFSDPAADGEVIQEAGERALSAGVTLRRVLEELTMQAHDVPIVLMTYLNPVLAYGLSEFADACGRAGVKGLIIPDLPHEEREMAAGVLKGTDIALIPLISLTSSKERIEKIARDAEGFIYAVTVNGVTGVRSGFDGSLSGHLKSLREIARVPVLAGFGISSPGQIVEFQQLADGVIVGSAVVSAFHKGNPDTIRQLAEAGRTPIRS